MLLIFGVFPKFKSLCNGNGICPACEKSVYFKLGKKYSVFSIFFIPLIPFGASYHATCSSCNSTMELTKEKGKNFEQGYNNTIHNGDMRILYNNASPVCPSCGARIIANQNFCYHCGVKF